MAIVSVLPEDSTTIGRILLNTPQASSEISKGIEHGSEAST